MGVSDARYGYQGGPGPGAATFNPGSGSGGGGGGSSFGDSARRFAESLPVVGGPLKAALGDPDQERMQRVMAQIAEQYRQYRPQMAQARMTGLGNQLSLFGPVNNLLSQMYGPLAQTPGAPGSPGQMFDLSKLMNNPMNAVPAASNLTPSTFHLRDGRTIQNGPGPKVDDSKVAVAKL